MRSPSRWLATVLAVALTTTLAAASPATAEPPPDASYVSDAPAAAPAAATLTLLTGDVVHVTEAAPERFAASVQPASGREAVTFHTLEIDDSVLVLPSDVVPYVSAGVLDQRLFDVPYLIAEGYDDASMEHLPLIVRHAEPSGDVTATSLGTFAAGGVTALDSIDGAALTADKDGLAGLWDAVADADVAGPRAQVEPDLSAGVAEIWLDGRVTVDLADSVPQVGAPQVWDAGVDGSGVTIAVLDTGIDENHPDLAGKVVAAQNFSNSATTDDTIGHGTHVAATAAGTGAASGGAAPGVAPAAELLSGKVLNDWGAGFDSWIIAGMEWAVAEGADVVNLSLGGAATDGTDPLSQAVNQLTADTGALFVISAGNRGTDYGVGSPGAATAALTVGAVDADDELASFSSRGPRVGDNALKPEITGPGVGIVAARADGTEMGTPVGEHHTAASGTSMSAPHVAGAAALLAQAHPELDPILFKDALVSTAEPHPDLDVFAQGGGRLDVARAFSQGVYGSGVLDFGIQTQPGEPVESSLTYANGTGDDITLELSVDLHNIDRDADASGALSPDAAEVTVPAGGSVDVAVALDVPALERGRHSGWITATGADGVVVRTAVATTAAGPKHTVTLRAQDADGESTSAPVVALHGEDRRNDVLWWIPSGEERTLEVEEGTYLLHGLVTDYDPQFEQVYVITDPELEITGDTEVVLDAGAATPVRIETPQPAEQRTVLSYYVHREMANGRTVNWGGMHFSTVQQVSVTPTAPLAAGGYEFSSRWQLVAPIVDAHVPGVSGPLNMYLGHNSPVFDGRKQLPLVSGGAGTEEDLAGVELAGAAVLIEITRETPWDLLDTLAEAGAEAALGIAPDNTSPWTVWRPVGFRDPLPNMAMSYDTGQRLLDRLAQPGTAQISLELNADSSYLYDVMHVEADRVPESVVHTVEPANSARFDVDYTYLGGFDWAKEQRFGWRPWQTYAWNDTQRIMQPGTSREEWVSAGDTLWHHRVHHEYTWDNMNPLFGGLTDVPASYDAGIHGTVSWHAPVIRPASPVGVPQLVSTRHGDVMQLRVPEFVDGSSRHFGPADAWTDTVSAQLWRDGELVADLPDAVRDVTTTAATADYRLELSTQRQSAEWQWATATETAWEFTSGHTDGAEPLPLLQVDYDVPTDLEGRVGGTHPLELSVRHQDGLPAPEGTQVSLEVSSDDGETWHAVPVQRTGDTFVAVVAPDSDAVSLRVHAEAADGSEVTQTVIRAYGVR